MHKHSKAEAVFEKVRELYGILPEASEKVTKGYLSDNLILNCNGAKYFLKKYRFKDSGRIRDVHAVKEYFYAKGIPVIMPILTKNGETFFEHEGGYYAVFPYVDGIHLSRDNLTEKPLKALAKMLARIHKAGKDADVPMDDHFKPWRTAASLAKVDKILGVISALPQKAEFDQKAEANLLLKKSLLEGSSLVTLDDLALKSDHLTHGDYFAQNVFFDAAGEVQNVFDFEKTEYAPRMFELFRAATLSIFVDDDLGEKHLKRFKLFVDAYCDEYPVPKEELQAGLMLYYMRLIHGAWVEGEHYLENNARVDPLLRVDIARVKFFAENLEVLKKLV